MVDEDVQRTTFSAELAENYRKEGRRDTLHQVPVMTLNQILRNHPLPRIDFLKIDAEGLGDRVVAGLDLSLHRPSVIVSEHADWLNCHFPEALAAAGYRQVLFDGVTRYYVAQEDDEELGQALSYPALCAGPVDSCGARRHPSRTRRSTSCCPRCAAPSRADERTVGARAGAAGRGSRVGILARWSDHLVAGVAVR